MTRYYDQNGKLLKRINFNPRSSLGLTGPRTELYDSNGNLILEKNEDSKGVIWNLSLNEYDKNGNLTKRTKFDIEHIYTEIFEYNSDNELIHTTRYDCNGQKRKSKRKTKRKEPYKVE
jgi:antitoxin component YwqK of YwqJK toxin-antitoxin module